jgi:membrane-associated protein
MPVVAGTAAMRRRSFTSATVVGALAWAVFLPVVGYYAYRFPVLRTIAFTIAGIFITVSLVGLAVMLVRDGLRRRRERATTAVEQDAPRDPSGD